MCHHMTVGENGLTYCVYGTRRLNDFVYYPRKNDLRFKSAGIIAADHIPFLVE